MKDRAWYEAEALMADLTIHRHTMTGDSEHEIERRIRDRYPHAVAVLVREVTRAEADGEGAWRP